VLCDYYFFPRTTAATITNSTYADEQRAPSSAYSRKPALPCASAKSSNEWCRSERSGRCYRRLVKNE
jgi:hypothetical protein